MDSCWVTLNLTWLKYKDMEKPTILVLLSRNNLLGKKSPLPPSHVAQVAGFCSAGHWCKLSVVTESTPAAGIVHYSE